MTRVFLPLLRREKRVLVGRDAQRIALIQRLFPVECWQVVRRFARWSWDAVRPARAGRLARAGGMRSAGAEPFERTRT